MEPQDILVLLLGGLWFTTTAAAGIIIAMFRSSVADLRNELKGLRTEVKDLARESSRITNLESNFAADRTLFATHIERGAHRDHPHPVDPIAYRAFVREIVSGE